MIVLPDAENRTIVFSKHRNVTDRRTDSQPVLLQRSALRAMRTAVKNYISIIRSHARTCSCIRLLPRGVKTTALERLLIYRVCLCADAARISRDVGYVFQDELDA